ncbi:hypothetical protein RZV17_14300 [Xanthomonas cannabis]|uniref:hypothetical protein n=1 Tax=Xanthomonas cannabis TaxID=1885674 RepID=UPI0033BD7B1F
MPQVIALRIEQHHQCRRRHHDARTAARLATRSTATVLPIDRDADGIAEGQVWSVHHPGERAFLLDRNAR